MKMKMKNEQRTTKMNLMFKRIKAVSELWPRRKQKGSEREHTEARLQATECFSEVGLNRSGYVSLDQNIRQPLTRFRRDPDENLLTFVPVTSPCRS